MLIILYFLASPHFVLNQTLFQLLFIFWVILFQQTNADVRNETKHLNNLNQKKRFRHLREWKKFSWTLSSKRKQSKEIQVH